MNAASAAAWAAAILHLGFGLPGPAAPAGAEAPAAAPSPARPPAGPPQGKPNGPSDADRSLRIYLPREAQVSLDPIQLGQVAVILCSDPTAERTARHTPLGRAPWPRERLLIDRATVLSRLAAAGIAKERVRLLGATEVAVVRRERVVPADRCLAAAEEFLHKAAPGGADCIYQVIRRPDEVVLSETDDLQFACSLDPAAPPGQVKVVVAVNRQGRQLALRQAIFKAMHAVRQAVVTREVPAGAALTEENVEVRTTYSDRPAEAEWKPPYGLLAVRRLAPGTIIRPGMTAEKKPDIIIQRDQAVRMRLEGPGFTIVGLGQALESGRPGEFIKVRNVDSRRVVDARVALDGTVEPVFQR